jgi:hypothetical protein
MIKVLKLAVVVKIPVRVRNMAMKVSMTIV